MTRTIYTIEFEHNERIKKIRMDAEWFLSDKNKLSKVGDEVQLSPFLGTPEQRAMYERQGLKFDGKTKYKIIKIFPPSSSQEKGDIQNKQNTSKSGIDTFQKAENPDIPK